MRSPTARLCSLLAVGLMAAAWVPETATAEKRNEISFLRGPYNTAFFHRENEAFRISAAIHYAHAKQHDVLLLTPLRRNEKVDAETEEGYVDFVTRLKAQTEPTGTRSSAAAGAQRIDASPVGAGDIPAPSSPERETVSKLARHRRRSFPVENEAENARSLPDPGKTVGLNQEYLR